MKLNVILPSLQGMKKQAQQQQLIRTLDIDLTALVEGALAEWHLIFCGEEDTGEALERLGRLFKEYFAEVEDFRKYYLLLRLLRGVLNDIQQAIRAELEPVAQSLGLETFNVKLAENIDGALVLQIEDPREYDETHTAIPNHHADRGTCV